MGEKDKKLEIVACHFTEEEVTNCQRLKPEHFRKSLIKTPKDGTPGKVEESGEDVVVTDKENDEAPHGARPLT